MLEREQHSAGSALGAIFPYFTEHDPGLSRQSTGRDPLGMLPVWSEIGRGLVPHLASPVHQVNGVKAVLLIHWLSEMPRFQKLMTGSGRARGFLRLMEGVLEYWLHESGLAVCFGSQALLAAGPSFSVSVKTGKTVANGLHQYYRGTCRRAGLLDNDWLVDRQLGEQFAAVWSNAATNALAGAIEPCLSTGSLAVHPLLAANGALELAFAKVFDDDAVAERLRADLFGGEEHRSLARDFLKLRSQEQSLRFDERVARLESVPLVAEIDRVRRCEPFLLVLQDVFDMLRASPGKAIGRLTDELIDCFAVVRQRALAFASLGEHVRSGRMRQMQALAAVLAQPAESADAQREVLARFMRDLVAYHTSCMLEREREALVVLEGDLVVLPVTGERDLGRARARLIDGHPWINDYYLNTAATLYKQLHGVSA